MDIYKYDLLFYGFRYNPKPHRVFWELVMKTVYVLFLYNIEICIF